MDPGAASGNEWDKLRVPTDRDIDQATEAFFRLLRNRQTELTQSQRIIFLVEYRVVNAT